MHTLPPLRTDIHFYPGPYHEDGLPSWQIYDPLSNQFYRIGLIEFEILARWKMKNAHAIIAHINAHTPLTLTQKDIDATLQFLLTSRLVIATDTQHAHAYKTHLFAPPFSWKSWIMKSFFYRVDLFKPDAFLEKTLPYLSPLFTPQMGYVIFLASLISLYLTVRELDTFFYSFTYFFTFSQISIFLCFLFLTKCLHELGHAYTAKYFGCHVESMGIIFLFLWPVFFTDSTGSWRLIEARSRFLIASAGVIVDMVTAILATLIWHYLPPGAAKSTAFFIATVAWILSLTINLNPFIRFDGYYMLSDAWHIPNLRHVANTLTRWHLHTCLLYPAPPAPLLPLSKRQHRKVILYGYGAWIFRLILFSSIALYTYTRFYKLLGIALAAMIVYYFFLFPLYQEARLFAQLKRTHTLRTYLYTLPTCFLLLLLALFYPWHTYIYAPSLFTYAKETKVFSQTAGHIVTQSIQEGDSVKKGAPLFTLDSPTLAYKEKKVNTALALMEWRLKKERGRTEALGIEQADWEALQAQKAKARIIVQKKQALRILSPHNGIVIALNAHLRPGVWIDKNTYIAHIIMPPKRILHAYVHEKDLSYIHVGDHARFYSPQLHKALPAMVLDIDPVNTSHLPEGYLSSQFGGPLAVYPQLDNAHRPFKLVESRYHIRLTPLNTSRKPLPQTLIGFVKIQGQARSFMTRIQHYFSTLLIKEATL